ncbi:phage terminase small subunit [Alkalibacterium sp. MB6]|uniref:phage terminase small subunit n=1 Tax=Alkalibacterium sp. MB6 TaxID=2081965 RepID=UPI001F19581C|nr:phage terminase small subunit [Alkalibacterium sp. MB6]
MTDWNAIRKEFEETTITMKALAEKHDVKPSTLRSRKNREYWQRGVATQRNKSSNVATDKPGAQKGNRNAKGNSGGKAPPGNKNAVTHGLFAKWLPEETQEIMESIKNKTQADMLWDSIMFQYTAILRAQKIMYVYDHHDLSKEAKKESFGEGGSMEEWEIQFAWDKQERFLNAQSRAMGTLSNLIKQFVSMTDEEDERRLKLRQMQSTLEKTEKEKEFIDERTKLIKGEKKDTSLLDVLLETVKNDD